MQFKQIKTDLFSFPSQYHNEKQIVHPGEEQVLESGAPGWGSVPCSRLAGGVASANSAEKGRPREPAAG